MLNSSRTVSRRRFIGGVGGLAYSAHRGLATSADESPRPADDMPLRLTALGQALIERDVRTPPYDGFAPLARRLAQSDVCFSNLEVAVDGPGAGKPTKTGLYFHAAEPAALDCLRALSINLLSLSNNHAWDLGADGLRTTIREVAARGFTHAGAGRNRDEAAAPTVCASSRGRVALVAMASNVAGESIARRNAPGVNHLAVHDRKRVDEADAERILKSVVDAAAQADYVLVYQHNHYWADDRTRPPEWQPGWARRCVDAGATLFIGHGVPLLHGIEIYRGAAICYSLGNLVFHTHTPPGHYPDEVWDSVLVECELSGGALRRLKLRPVRLTDGLAGDDFLKTRGRPQLAAGIDAERILKRLQRRSEPYATQFVVDGDQAEVQW